MIIHGHEHRCPWLILFESPCLSRWHVHADEYAKAVNDHPDARVAAVWDENPERGREMGRRTRRRLRRRLRDVARATRHRRRRRHVADRPASRVDRRRGTRRQTRVHREGARDAPRRRVRDRRRGARLVDPLHDLVSAAHDRPARARQSDARFAARSATSRWCASASRTTARCATGCPEHFFDPVACGGGAMIDLGAHGMYLSRWLLGTPRRCTSIFNSVTGRAVEDNAVSVIEFENNAVAINETSFVSWGGAYSVEIDGTQRRFSDVEPAQRPHAQRRRQSVAAGRTAAGRSDADSALDRSASAAAARPISEWASTKRVQLSEMMHAAYRSHRGTPHRRLRQTAG